MWGESGVATESVAMSQAVNQLELVSIDRLCPDLDLGLVAGELAHI
jgi:hypothetical protein